MLSKNLVNNHAVWLSVPQGGGGAQQRKSNPPGWGGFSGSSNPPGGGTKSNSPEGGWAKSNPGEGAIVEGLITREGPQQKVRSPRGGYIRKSGSNVEATTDTPIPGEEAIGFFGILI
jgi:hypothetical protein